MKKDRRMEILTERLTRRLAGGTSRRSMLTRLGAFLVAAPALPLLPVSRRAQAAQQPATDFTRNAQTKDATQCNYWRYCGSDGYMCACCGGDPHTCPPGTTPSPTSWIGTCINPDDKQTYLIAYQDCCGKDSCGQCACLNTDSESPSYRPVQNNDTVWCFGSSSMVYHCSSAMVVGLAR